MTGADPLIDPTVRIRIDAELDRIEREQEVRILLAVESGSRAWRFASPDSDYDVRFIYVRPLEDYLSIQTPRDVIETPLDATLDVNGWDLRKALQLMVKSNAVLLEWLVSPVQYRADQTVRDRLAALARTAANLPALAFHYDRLARGAWAPDEAEDIRLKSYFYALRPALALRWLRDRGEAPPMDLPSLMAGTDPALELTEAVGRLLAIKARSDETVRVGRVPVIEAFLATTLRDVAPPPRRWDFTDSRRQADELFRGILGQSDAVQIPNSAAPMRRNSEPSG
jgi:predicted nucleotidyltransferase